MRVLLINTSERIGGAAVAASRLMEALKKHGVKAKMLVRDKQTEQLTVVALGQKWRMKRRFLWERFVIWTANRFQRKNLFAVDIANAGADVTTLPEFQEADLIHLHWINQGMLSLKTIDKILASGKPVVWTMHDMWPCTAICHHARECDKYQTECHHCPYIRDGRGNKDLAYRIFHRKKQLYQGRHLYFAACSQWLQRLAQKSALLSGQHIVNIPNAINTALFKPGNQQEARRRCLLPTEKRLMLFGSVKITDKRKGIDYLIAACKTLTEQHPELKEQLGVAVFGNQSTELEHLLPFRVYPLNYVSNEQQLVDIYNAVDLFVTPSLEENLPNTLMEAMACGTPCVGFDIGGIPEMIDHLRNGYVAQYKSAEDFANGIYHTLTTPNYRQWCEEACHKAVTHYSENTIANRYIELYQKAIGRNV